MKCFVFLILFSIISFADNNVVQVPDSCVDNKITPCLIKAKSNIKLVWDHRITLDLEKEALVEVQQNESSIRFDILSGLVRLQLNKDVKGSYKILGFDVKTNQAQYVSVKSVQIELFDAESLDLKTFVQEKSTKNKERSFVLQKSEFLNRTELVQYLAQFYSDSKALKSVLSTLSAAYQEKLSSELGQQAEFLKKKQVREIASIEFEEKRRIAEQIQQEKDRKRSRELFFIRTFK